MLARIASHSTKYRADGPIIKSEFLCIEPVLDTQSTPLFSPGSYAIPREMSSGADCGGSLDSFLLRKYAVPDTQYWTIPLLFIQCCTVHKFHYEWGHMARIHRHLPMAIVGLEKQRWGPCWYNPLPPFCASKVGSIARTLRT